MFRRFSVNFAILSMFIDLLVVISALAAAAYIRPIFNIFPYIARVDRIISIPHSLYLIFAITWVVIFLLMSVYDGRRNLYVTDELTSISLATILAAVSLAGMLYLSYREVSRLLFIMFVLITYVGMISWRWFVRIAFRTFAGSWTQTRNVLIVGAGPVGHKMEEQIRNNHFMGLNLIGFLDDDTRKRNANQDVLGAIKQAREIIIQHNVNDVVIALPNRAFKLISDLVAELHDMPVKVWVIPDYFGLALHKAVAEEFAGVPMLDLRAPALNDYQRMTKRIFDILVILAVMPVALPVMGLIALLIWMEDHGPILFHQPRAGENGKEFRMLKFRTMVPNAEELRYLVEKRDERGRLIHKSEDDPRVTKIGRFLRRSSLDELPQLFNILKGQMSLVGPRPELPYLVDQYEPWQRKRFAVPQGITGWWQVNGRSDRPMHLNTQDDLYYVQHYSLLLDIYILVKTIYVVIKGRGAY